MSNRDPIWPACDDCPANASCRPVPHRPCFDGPLELAIVGEAPGQLENRDGIPFVGPSGVLLKAALRHNGYDTGRILMDNALRMPMKKDQMLSRHCVVNAIAEIRRRKVKLVVATGAPALDALTFVLKGKARKGIMQWEGLMVEPATDTFPAIAALRHPAAILRSLGVEPHWTDLIGNLRSLTYRPTVPFYVVQSRGEFAKLVGRLEGPVSIDYETTGLEPRLHELRSVALTGLDPEHGVTTFAAAAKHVEPDAIRQLDGRLIAQNAHFEALWSRKLTGQWLHFARDTMIAAYLKDENAPKGLTHLVRRYYPQWAGYDLAVMEAVKTEKKAEAKSFADIPLDDLLPYNAGDARTTYELGKDLPRHPLERMLLDAAMVFARLEWEGVKADTGRVEPVSAALEAKFDAMVKRIRSHKAVRLWERDNGHEVNVRSRPQVASILYDRRYVGLRNAVLTQKTGKRSTSAKALKHVKHPLVALLKDARELSQRNSTFVKSLPEQTKVDGCVHPAFSVAATVTGQITCKRPNLTNVKDLPEIRSLYVPSKPDGIVVSADYSQSQLAFLGMFANDERIIRAYRDGEDMHRFTAKDAFGVEDPTKEQRNRGKTINYAIMFGEGSKKLAEDLQVSEDEATAFIARWFKVNKGAARFVAIQHAVVVDKGVVDSVWQQLRHLPAAWSTKYGEIHEAMRQAVNFPIANADRLLTLWAMIRVDAALRTANIGRVMVEMHDSISADVWREADLRRCVEIMYRVMVIDAYEELSWMRFPMRIDVSWGKDWSCPQDFVIDEGLKKQARSVIMDGGGER